jgi:GDPmannose 4,6-dehydratase
VLRDSLQPRVRAPAGRVRHAKITRAAAAIKLGLEDAVLLGDMSAVRGWSFAGDMMLGAWLMLQQDEPDDYTLASGIGHTVAEFAERAFGHLGLRAEDRVSFAVSLQRAPEPTPRVGDANRARQRLGWRPTVSFEQLVDWMVELYPRAAALTA